jgi:ribose transport system substrate-binding protein
MVNRGIVAMLLVGVVGLGAAGCGGSSDSGSGSGSGNKTGGVPAGFQENVDLALTRMGTFKSPPSSAPKHEAGKHIALISCGQAVVDCATAMTGAEDAAKALGWETTLFDSKGDPNAAGTGIRNAIAQKVDGIYIYFIDCTYIRGPLQQAKKAGIPIAAAQGVDCDETDPGAEPLWDVRPIYVEGGLLDWARAWNRAQAQYVIAKFDGKPHTYLLGDDTTVASKESVKEWERVYAKCSTCKLYPELFPMSEFNVGLQGRTQQALLKHPDIDSVGVVYEAIVVSGVASAVRASGRKLLLDVSTGGEATMDLLRSRPDTSFGAGYTAEWESWASIDGLLRNFAGEAPVNSGMGIQLFDADHNVPESGGWQAPIDFKGAYRKAWGVAG